MRRAAILVTLILIALFSIAAVTERATDVRISEPATHEHREIHAGRHWLASFDSTLGSGDSLFFVITTPNSNKQAHLYFTVEGAFVTDVRFYENPTCSSTTDTLTAYNNNRWDGGSATLVIRKDAVATAYGTRIYRESFGHSSGASRGGGDIRAEHEWILKRNEDYLLAIRSGTNSNNIAVQLNWYEEGIGE